MKSFSSILAWLLLVAVLAVPSFLFYNWWSKSKQQASSEIAQSPVTTNVFPSDKNASPAAGASGVAAQPAAQPLTAAATPPAQEVHSVQQAAPASQPPVLQPPSASANAPEPDAEQASEEEPQAAPQQAEQAAPAQPAGEQGVEASTVPKPISYFEPKTERDPTLTPDDYRRIEAARRQRAENARMRAQEERNRPKPAGPETLISLQGIVGDAAIINGDMYRVGQKVRGIKILKIGPDYVICEYQGKRFRKVMR